ncbi:MAG: CPBP family intramembrane metalloprotease [Acidimicrobiia bacterium]|nr:CPBP family intramembrane metalloprotease [Acidimicrobiia bacterium]MDX2467376.1 CPBP family intramembrane metalloprotease [Acidimicrobiia bacterium]
MIAGLLPPPELEVRQDERADKEAFIVIIAGTLLLYVFHYWGRPDYFVRSGLIDWVASNIGGTLEEHPGVGAYLYWGFTSLVLRTLVPAAIIFWLIKDSPRDWGYRISGTLKHFPVYGLMYLVMLPILVWISSLESFMTYYPFYDRAAEGGSAFWLYEFGYVFQFVGIEAFFRGFLTFGLARRFGLLGVAIMTVPYTMIHFGKPAPEAFAAIIAGLALGYLALRSKSFVPGIFLHVSVAITMDMLVLWRLGALGNVF